MDRSQSKGKCRITVNISSCDEDILATELNMFKKVVINMNIKVEFFQDDLIQAIGAGIYEISIDQNSKSEVLYIGESVFVLVRCASHLYELKKSPGYFGFTDKTINDPGIILKFRLIEKNSESASRKKREMEFIKKRKPLSQSGIRDRQKNVKDKIEALTQFLNDNYINNEKQ